MAIIPAEEKVFMVSNSTNTTYSGSAALKAMQQWYTMQDVTDSVSESGAITLQQVTEAGNSTDQLIAVNVNDGTGITASSTSGPGIQGYSDNGAGVAGISDVNYGVYGQSVSGHGGYFTSDESAAVYAFSQYNSGVYGQSSEGYGVYGVSSESVGGYFASNNSYAVFGFSSSNIGVYGESEEAAGVFGQSGTGYGVQGQSSESAGGYFSSGETYSLVAAQSAAKPGGGSWSVFSDSRIKENITPYTKGLAEILLVNTVTYDYNGLAGTTKGAKFTGIIAQEIKEIFPETVSTYKAKLNEEDEEKTDLYDFNSSDLTFALINAIKELNEKIKILEAK
jgi:hypothetical protein